MFTFNPLFTQYKQIAHCYATFQLTNCGRLFVAQKRGLWVVLSLPVPQGGY